MGAIGLVVPTQWKRTLVFRIDHNILKCLVPLLVLKRFQKTNLNEDLATQQVDVSHAKCQCSEPGNPLKAVLLFSNAMRHFIF